MFPDGSKQPYGCLHLCFGYHAMKFPYQSANYMTRKAQNLISTLDPESLDYDIIKTAVNLGQNIDILAIQLLGLPFESMNYHHIVTSTYFLRSYFSKLGCRKRRTGSFMY
jgi:hypothetical protein